MRKSFRSSFLRGEEKEVQIDYAFPEEREKARQEALEKERERRRKTNKKGARAGMLLAPLTMAYAVYAHDVPAFFVGASLLCILAQPYARDYLGERGEFVAQALRTFAITLFGGAIVLLFI